MCIYNVLFCNPFSFSLLVTGDSEGQIKFFDGELKMLNWYDSEPSYGHTVSISFAHQPKLQTQQQRSACCISIRQCLIEPHCVYSRVDGEDYFPPESTMSAKPFVIADFTVSTSCAVVTHVTTNGSVSEVILNEHEAAINALAAHPSLPRVLIGSYSCKLKLWDYQTK